MKSVLFTAAIVVGIGSSFGAAHAGRPVKNVVLVHGAYADGSRWRAVSDLLSRDGYRATVVQEPETSLEDDVAATTRPIKQAAGLVVLVGIHRMVLMHPSNQKEIPWLSV